MSSDLLLQELPDERNVLRGYGPLPRLRVVAELDAVRESLRTQEPPVPLRWQRVASVCDTLIKLAIPEPILVHYTGHGSVVVGEPILCFDDGTSKMRPHPLPDLAIDLSGWTCHVFLNACRTADSTEPSANLVPDLVQNDILAVLGMQACVGNGG